MAVSDLVIGVLEY